MSRRDNHHLRCPRCRMHGSLCVCALVPRIVTRSRLILVIHRYEARKPSNTGLLAAACLPNHEIVVRGNDGEASAPLSFAGLQPVLLFPHEEAIPLERFARESAGPFALVVPDGNWRQGSKVRQRVPGLRDVPCVTLPVEPDAPTIYRLRSEAHAHGLATMEAIARAFGVLEGPDVRRQMEDLFRVMVERTLWSRGQLATADVTTGIPEGIERHDPRRRLPESQ